MSTETLELEIADVVYRGKGLARRESFVVFVPGVLPGEKVRATVTNRRRRYAEAVLDSVLVPSPHRVEPFCPLNGTCPGCCYQHVDYDEEVRLKQAQLVDQMTHLGGVNDAGCETPVPAPADRGYRNKIVLHVQKGRHGGRLGYVGADNRTVIDVERCPLAVDAINEHLRTLRSDRRTGRFLRRHRSLTLRHTANDGAVSWWDRPRQDAPRLFEQTCLGKIRVPRAAFFQVNAAVADSVLEYVMGILREIAPRHVIDLYCGVGMFALAAAQAGVTSILGVDSDDRAVRAAHRNAVKLELSGLEFIRARVIEVAQEALAAVSGAETTLILDPPRRGLEPGVIEAVGAERPANVIYVSCAADTLARDTAAIAQHGYELVKTRLFDMFPRTPYFETVAWFAQG